MVTKAIIQSINRNKNRCQVRMPLFESAASTAIVDAEALISIPPGIFNNLSVGDIVFVAFEENALEKPIIIGKLFTGVTYENLTPGGVGILDKLVVRTEATQPGADTTFVYKDDIAAKYAHFTSPKKIADYILWLESLTKALISKLEGHFRCLKNWTQWQLQAANVEVDDGDLDKTSVMATACQYQTENGECRACGNCTRDTKNTRSYPSLPTTKIYPNL